MRCSKYLKILLFSTLFSQTALAADLTYIKKWSRIYTRYNDDPEENIKRNHGVPYPVTEIEVSLVHVIEDGQNVMYLSWVATPLTESSHMNQGPTFQLVEHRNEVKNQYYAQNQNDSRAQYNLDQLKMKLDQGKTKLYSHVKIAMAMNEEKSYKGTAAILRTPYDKSYKNFQSLRPILKNGNDIDKQAYQLGVRQWIEWSFTFDGTEIEKENGKTPKLYLFKTHGPGLTSKRAYIYDYVAKKMVFDSDNRK
jgi:hypothetical protein